MDCRDFEAKIDQYVDAVLSGSDMESAGSHVQICKGCNDLVTSYQHASALLRTAVADKAAAVDVSGLWESIEARLDAEPAAAGPKPARAGLIDRIRALDVAGRLHGLMLGVLGPAPVRVGAFAAAAAALAFLVFGSQRLPGLDGLGDKVASVFGGGTPHKVHTSVARGHDGDLRAGSRHVRIDKMEVAQGRTVAMWARPKTRTQVIWVNSPDDSTGGAFGVSNASTDGR